MGGLAEEGGRVGGWEGVAVILSAAREGITEALIPSSLVQDPPRLKGSPVRFNERFTPILIRGRHSIKYPGQERSLVLSTMISE